MKKDLFLEEEKLVLKNFLESYNENEDKNINQKDYCLSLLDIYIENEEKIMKDLFKDLKEKLINVSNEELLEQDLESSIY